MALQDIHFGYLRNEPERTTKMIRWRLLKVGGLWPQRTSAVTLLFEIDSCPSVLIYNYNSQTPLKTRIFFIFFEFKIFLKFILKVDHDGYDSVPSGHGQPLVVSRHLFSPKKIKPSNKFHITEITLIYICILVARAKHDYVDKNLPFRNTLKLLSQK